jgi:hypothetical protein
MDHIFSVLPKVLRKRGLQEHAEGALVVHRAQQWLHERLPHLATVISVRNVKENVLHIVCIHSIAVQECQNAIPDLQDYLRSNCAFAGILEVRVGRQ